jgi:hypothetical protein
LVLLASRLNMNDVTAALPARPGRRVLAAYLIADAVGPYTSAATEALDLGVVVPVAVIAAVQLLRQRPVGSVLALIMLVINVCIGVVLMSQAAAQLVSGVPLTAGEIVTKMLTFAALTLVAGGLLALMWRGATTQAHQGYRTATKTEPR